MHAEADDAVASTDRASDSAASAWRDPKLWSAVAINLALRIAVVVLLLGLSKSRITQVLQTDLSIWTDFITEAREGRLPYRDVPTDAPVLQSAFYWLLAKLTAAVDLQTSRPIALCSTLVSALADALNAALFYRLVQRTHPHSALRATVLWSFSLAALALGPFHLDPLIVTLLLLAYRMHLGGRFHMLAAILSIAAGLTPFAIWLFAASLAQRARTQPLRRTIGSIEVFLTIQGALYLPFVLAGWPVPDSLMSFAYGILGLPRELISFAPDTLLGLLELWCGHLGVHNIAGWLATALALTATILLVRRRPPLPATLVSLAIAAMLLRPSAGSSWQLWLYPFLLLTALHAATYTRAWLLVGLALLDITTVLAQPLSWASMLHELHSIAPSAAVEHGGARTFFFTLFVLAKLATLVTLARSLPRSPQPSAANAEPLTWPTIDFAAARATLTQPSVALWLTAALAVCQSLMTSSVMLRVPEYSDEVYHGEQVEMLCRGETTRRKGITMLLGYHVVTATIAQDDCSRQNMRRQNVAWGLCATFLAFLILQTTGAKNVASRVLSFHFLPVLFPYHFFVYTDVLAIVLILLTLYLSFCRRWAIAGLVASVSIAVRQTNALVVMLVALLAFVDTPRGDSVQAWFKALLSKIWTCALGLLGFAVFVFKNHGIAVGDRESHPFGFHIGNVAFVLFLLAVVALPINLERIWRERRQLAAVSFGLALAALYFTYAYLFRIENVYNTHEPFIRNEIVTWAASNTLTKTLFFLPIALGFAAVWTTPLIRRSYWICLPVVLVGLVPESLIEQRYAIFPLTLWLLLRRDGSTFAEGLTAIGNLAISAWLLQQVASGAWSI